MTIPAEPLPVPPRVRELADGARLEPVWRNELGGLTFRTDDGRYIKHGPRNAETSMADEAARLGWAAAYTPVPHTLAWGADAADEWLVTSALPGRSAVDPRWVAEPAVAVRALGAGLRALHEALPAADCPYDWRVPARLANAARRGIQVPAALSTPPPPDLLVVCHGDACAPNTLLDDDGRWTGHVDLGALGVADRWADIAVAAASCGWNYGPGWEDVLLGAYGIERDPQRMAYYAALWDAT
ncbi:aminoglycoside 3'-phosphotransferase [Microbacterium sp. zg.Y1090]|uniref:aminoglycoside 3'-phosphotransferase n=1 Tax=Microbacterium TaxID=33882 RepID=UPI00214B0770|nr:MULTISPECIES: aminoglycoside 3'-phosphotransferase [unclassified Microbacterium]MCR2813274.1 aminoglycoside 3'-phosphotransferase [Microbacterium sp. zg.Y1084]MCR2819587.1 aminoglycoside 3'-phosphotransferase [Microbacterium sp. zg.Y1090]MDL5487441.1 aminoglycoside 3'-phosphotransferase [Microbacterium sp. zg-Y1211]WIM28554.1 aminoglycoside 3'-phosphotransferase [Microbacterium sp. zg-Y1090]